MNPAVIISSLCSLNLKTENKQNIVLATVELHVNLHSYGLSFEMRVLLYFENPIQSLSLTSLPNEHS
jgi:hypothetical protein